MSIHGWLLTLLLLLCPTLANAADVNAVGIPKDVIGAPPETLGSIIGTIGYRMDVKPYVDSAAFAFRKVGSQEVGFAQVTRSHLGMGGNAKAFTDGKFHYAAFKIDLPEGQYEIIRAVGIYELGSCIVGNSEGWRPGEPYMRYINKTDFSVPFEVKRGKVLYLGSLLAHGTLDKGKVCFIPIPVPSTVYFSYADKWQRDAATFSEGPLAVDPNLVEHANLAVNEHTGYYIIAEDHIPEAQFKMSDYKSGRASLAGKIAAYQAEHGGAPAAAPAPAVEPQQAPAAAASSAPVSNPR
jgi:hypothetical protein